MDRFCFYLPVLEGRTEALIVNFYECTYLLFHDLPERLLGKGDYGETYPKAELSREAFFALRCILEEKFSGVFETGGYPGLAEEEGLREQAAGDVLKRGRVAVRLSKEETFAVLRRERSPGTALKEECGYEIYDYFEEEVLLSALRAFRDGAMSERKFCDWCIAASKAFAEGGPYRGQGKLWALYDSIGYFFDGLSFFCAEGARERRREMGEAIAQLRWFAHLRADLLGKKKTPFCTDGLQIFCAFAFCACAHKSNVWEFCLADLRGRRVNYFQVDDPWFDEKRNYTFLSRREFSDLSDKFADFTLDRSLRLGRGKKK